ncbi:uncharacterized protein J7T54_002225 [Emericellopsis cladophorae]|uniref:Uncharacterized protein n=1 Tax=Emericellopsis cladophorae TaxID=2686198 RepID=A0A9P9Y0H7_9HYPO|nr:uncharacterized protein J7T54_002225 [Emericellopsis cladophorae]KAI6781333.1 hypothetical protein J7T54_002225 [Emericellopsis cladophorae]
MPQRVERKELKMWVLGAPEVLLRPGAHWCGRAMECSKDNGDDDVPRETFNCEPTGNSLKSSQIQCIVHDLDHQSVQEMLGTRCYADKDLTGSH